MTKTALVTGITGQDGAYLARLLLDRDYRVVGTHRAAPGPDLWRLHELDIAGHPRLMLAPYDIAGPERALHLVEQVHPAEIYNLAGQTSAIAAAADPHGTAEVNGMGALHLLEAVRRVAPEIRFFQAGSAELFGDAAPAPQSESTPFRPGNAYGVAKLFAHWATVNYREAYGVFACSGLLFNHESPLRGPEFVTRKIAQSIAAISMGHAVQLELGDLDARRDWGFAGDYVLGMWAMLQADAPGTYVLASGRTCSVREFVDIAARIAGVELAWRGSGHDEQGVDRRSGRTLVCVNPAFCRPAPAHERVGDSTLAARVLGWQASTSIEELGQMMIEAELRRLAKLGGRCAAGSSGP